MSNVDLDAPSVLRACGVKVWMDVLELELAAGDGEALSLVASWWAPRGAERLLRAWQVEHEEFIAPGSGGRVHPVLRAGLEAVARGEACAQAWEALYELTDDGEGAGRVVLWQALEAWARAQPYLTHHTGAGR